VFKNLKMFKKPPKTDGDDIFDRLTASTLTPSHRRVSY
jgi:DNA topoisomerase I